MEQADDVGIWVLESQDGEGGYPGAVRFEFAVLLESGPALDFIYRAKLINGEACPVNLTHVRSFTPYTPKKTPIQADRKYIRI